MGRWYCRPALALDNLKDHVTQMTALNLLKTSFRATREFSHFGLRTGTNIETSRVIRYPALILQNCVRSIGYRAERRPIYAAINSLRSFRIYRA